MHALALALAAATLAQPSTPPDPRINAETGRAVAAWPHDRPFDHLHMRLELDFPDINQPRLTGVETLTVSPIGKARSELVLDTRGPEIESVTLRDEPLRFDVVDEKLRIRFPAPIRTGQSATVVIRYSLDFSKHRGEGLTFSKPRADAASLTFASVQLHTQGEAATNSKWYPCHDFPNEKLTTELLINIAEGYEVVANGHLAGKWVTELVDGEAGRVLWHWKQDKPHTNYLVAFAVGKFAVVEIGGESTARPGLPMPAYVPIGDEEDAARIFANTPAMVALFERLFDEPYPWDKYAQVCVRDFAAGGMENTSNTFLTVGTSSGGAQGSRDDLISHELAHQWFGDLITCNSWEHLWLNEGWASYSECLWDEHKDPAATAEASRSAYLKAVVGYVRQQRGRNRRLLPEGVPVVSNRYTDPESVFGKADDPYAKGAVILHMLRERLGDEAFFKGTAAYIDQYKFDTAETDDFRRSLEDASGQSLDRFFAQWCYRAGLPRLAVEYTWDEDAKTLGVTVSQTQKIDYLNPAFAMTLPLYLKFEDGSSRWVDLTVNAKETAASFTLPSKPTQASIDPNITSLAGVEVKKPLAMWIEEAERGVTIAARLAAIDALVSLDTTEARAALTRFAADTDPMIREACMSGGTGQPALRLTRAVAE